MGIRQERATVAAIQAAPVFLDRAATVEKACRLIEEASAGGATLAVFPEAFIPAYPDWVWALRPSEGELQMDLYARLLENAITIPSEETRILGESAARAGCYVVIGVNELNAEASRGSLFNTLIYFDDFGRIIGKHRKLVPTAAERLVWTGGDGSSLETFDSPVGRVGALICWENYMPLARYAMYAAGTEIYVAPTWSRGESWIATLRHIGLEGRVYAIGCCIAMRVADIPDSIGLKQHYPGDPSEWINEGWSAIVDPAGELLAGPLKCEEGILYADVDLGMVRRSRWMLDVAGHYARSDVFRLVVDRGQRPLMTNLTEQLADENASEVVEAATERIPQL